MKNETSYGIISNFSVHPENIYPILFILKKKGVDKLILNGNLFDSQDSLGTQVKNFQKVLDYAGKSELETYVLPGVLERPDLYLEIMKISKNKYKNINDTLNLNFKKFEDHNLIFIPGGPFLNSCKGFCFGKSNSLTSGYYLYDGKNSYPYSKKSLFIPDKNEKLNTYYFKNLKDFSNNSFDSKNTIIFSGYPPKFSGKKFTDFVQYGISSNGKKYVLQEFKDEFLRKSIPFNENNLESLIQRYFGIKIIGKNFGSRDLSDFIKENNITKVVSTDQLLGEIFAHTFFGEVIEKNVWTDNLMLSLGSVDFCEFNILTVSGEKIKFESYDISLMNGLNYS